MTDRAAKAPCKARESRRFKGHKIQAGAGCVWTLVVEAAVSRTCDAMSRMLDT